MPIKRENLSASGLGVYIQAMALRKCVIVSDGPQVRGLLPHNAAVIVPPGDPQALANAIEALYDDVVHREEIAAVGYRYAMSLGDDHQLARSIMGVLKGEPELPQI